MLFTDVARSVHTSGVVMRSSRLSLPLLVAITLAALTGCANVAPYERGILALPSMTPEDTSTGFDEHVRAVSEGSTGGFGGGGGGCGCN
jgi:hypothetical protein